MNFLIRELYGGQSVVPHGKIEEVIILLIYLAKLMKFNHCMNFFELQFHSNSTFKSNAISWTERPVKQVTLRWAATVVRGVLVMRHRSADPGVGVLALGSNSFPAWCRLSFCSPKLRALRSPWNTCRVEVTGLLRLCCHHVVSFTVCSLWSDGLP